jgi:hypothetical protein
MYTADSNTISEWDVAEKDAIECAEKMLENGIPFKQIKWRSTFGNHATAAKRAYEAAKCNAI